MTRYNSGTSLPPELRTAIDRIRRDFSLSTIADRSGLKLHRAGDEWKACCPFHKERTPSFTIYASDRRFMCFGCGVQGDVLDYMKHAYGVGLIEAARTLRWLRSRSTPRRSRAISARQARSG